jgi:hypothetical protein
MEIGDEVSMRLFVESGILFTVDLGIVDWNCCGDEDYEQSGNKKNITDTSALVTMWMQCVGDTLLEHQQVDASRLGGGATGLDGGGVVFQRN